MPQPVIYLCNGFGPGGKYKSIAAFYQSFDKDYLNTECVTNRPPQKPFLIADVRTNGLETWEGRKLDIDFTVGQEVHKFRFHTNVEPKGENGRSGFASEINHKEQMIGETLDVYRADNGGQVSPLQCLFAHQGWYFLRVYYCTAAPPRTEPFKLQKQIQLNQKPLIPASSKRMMHARAPEHPMDFENQAQEVPNGVEDPNAEPETSAELDKPPAETDSQADEAADSNFAKGLDPEGNPLPKDNDAPAQDTDTGAWPTEEPAAAAEEANWKNEQEPGSLVASNGTLNTDGNAASAAAPEVSVNA